MWDSIPYDDDEYKTKVSNTESNIVETVQKALSHLDKEPGAPTEGKAGGSYWDGRNTWKGKEDDDSIEKQMKNTTAQVVGTFKGLSTAFQQAGEKVNEMWGQDNDSSKH